MDTSSIIIIIIYIIGVIIVFKLHITEFGMLLLNPIILLAIIVVSLGSWISLLFIKIFK